MTGKLEPLNPAEELANQVTNLDDLLDAINKLSANVVAINTILVSCDMTNMKELNQLTASALAAYDQAIAECRGKDRGSSAS